MVPARNVLRESRHPVTQRHGEGFSSHQANRTHWPLTRLRPSLPAMRDCPQTYHAVRLQKIAADGTGGHRIMIPYWSG